MAESTRIGIVGDIFDIINDRQQISFNELSDISFSRGIAKEKLAKALAELEGMKVIASRSRGGVLTYYPLQEGSLRKVLDSGRRQEHKQAHGALHRQGLRDKPDI